MKTTKHVRIYQGVGTAPKERTYAAMKSKYRCPHCKCGVRLKKNGMVVAHAIGGGNVHLAKGDIPCLGSGEFPKIDKSRRVKPPRKLSAGDGSVEE